MHHFFGQPRMVDRARRFQPKFLGVFPFRVQVGRKDVALPCRCLSDDDGAPAIAENHRNVPAVSVELQTGGMDLCSHHQNVTIPASLDKLVSDGKTVKKARALVANIQRAGRSNT